MNLKIWKLNLNIFINNALKVNEVFKLIDEPLFFQIKVSNYLGVTVLLRNSCRKSCVMAKIHAKSGETSHTAPLKRDFPQNFRNTARLMLSNKNTQVTPVKKIRGKNVFL